MNQSKKILVATLLLLGIIFSFTNVALAFYSSFGGTVQSTSSAGVTCRDGQGPIRLNMGTSRPYFMSSSKGSLSKGNLILGLYLQVPNISSCYTGEDPYEIPSTVYSIGLFGKAGF